MASTNGLVSRDAKTLASLLRKAEALEPCKAYLGRERGELATLTRDLKARLEPESPELLEQRAKAFFEPLEPLDWAKGAWADL